MIKVSKDATWHVKKRIEILRKYPEIRQYQKPYYYSIIWILFLVLIQFTIGFFTEYFNLSIPLVGLVSFINANSLYHSFASFIHENSHGLVLGFSNQVLVSYLIELGLSGFGGHRNYEITHKRNHHASLNIKEVDSECTHKAHMTNLTNIVSNPFLNRLLFLVDLLPFGSIIMQEIGKKRLSNEDKKEVSQLKSYFKISFIDNFHKILMALMSSFIFYYLIKLKFYKFLLFKIWTISIYQGKFSMFRRGQSISEHYATDYNLTNPTQSTYGFLSNLFGFNTGYHDEHHTFPTIPWIYLPKLKQIAPEYFNNNNNESYFYLWFKWFRSDFKNTYYRNCEVEFKAE
jgi:sphingolipid delta-4 desaturase